MNISIALIFQIVNFGIAYCIIRTLLLKPAVTEILQDEEHKARLKEAIDNATQSNKSKEETLVHTWDACKTVFAQHAPDVVQTEQKLRSTPELKVPAIQEIDTDKIEPMSEEITDDLIQRIDHVR